MNLKNRSWDHLLTAVGGVILRYSLVLIFLGFGVLKFTPDEAAAIQSPASHSPVLFWLYLLFDPQRASAVIGMIEIALAALIASRPITPLLSAVGSLGTAFALLTTLSFLITTPHLDQTFAFFIVKDLTLLGAALWSAGEALKAAKFSRASSTKFAEA